MNSPYRNVKWRDVAWGAVVVLASFAAFVYLAVNLVAVTIPGVSK